MKFETDKYGNRRRVCSCCKAHVIRGNKCSVCGTSI